MPCKSDVTSCVKGAEESCQHLWAIQGDPFKTLFVARVSFEATERKLKREFEEYGPVKSIRLVHDKNDGTLRIPAAGTLQACTFAFCKADCCAAGKSRGYAFIEYEHKNDMKLAYKMADGKKIEGKRVVVDVERGRTVPNWSVLTASLPEYPGIF